jgi:hypothetical protein
MHATRRLIAVLAFTTAGLTTPAQAVTTLNDTFTNPADWSYLPGWAKGDVNFDQEGATILLTGDKPFQNHTLRYTGPGFFRSNPDGHQSFNWFGHQGPITYSVTLADIPGYSTTANKPGYTVSLVLVCNDSTPYSDPANKAATVLVLRIEDVGPRPVVNNQNQFVAQILFKVNTPNAAAAQAHRIVRFSNDQPDVMPTPMGTWSFTIDGNEIWITNCLGQRSERATLPSDLVLAHAADNASLYLTVTNGFLPPGPVAISRVNVAPGAR